MMACVNTPELSQTFDGQIQVNYANKMSIVIKVWGFHSTTDTIQ